MFGSLKGNIDFASFLKAVSTQKPNLQHQIDSNTSEKTKRVAIAKQEKQIRRAKRIKGSRNKRQPVVKRAFKKSLHADCVKIVKIEIDKNIQQLIGADRGENVEKCTSAIAAQKYHR